MDSTWSNVIFTLLVIVAAIVVHQLIRASIEKISIAKQLKPSRGGFVQRVFGLLNMSIVGIIIVSIWGVSAENLWIFMTSVLGIVAIGFFASWSLLSNVVATVVLFIVNPFKIDDEIIILPEGIRGTVLDIDTLFIVLENEEGDITHLPSNFLFQKMITTVNKDKSPAEKVTHHEE